MEIHLPKGYRQKMKTKKWNIRIVLVTSLFLLVGCGGGGGSTDNTPNSSTLNGVAAVADPIANGAIKVICADGDPLSTFTDSTGAWQVTISGQTLPCAVEVSGGTINNVVNTIDYHSIATSFGTVNVTPFTDLMLANLAGTATPNVWFSGLTPSVFTTITSTSVNTALAYQCAALSGLTQLCAVNPVTTVFTPTGNNIMAYMLRALQVAMTNSGVTYTSLLNDASISGYAAPVASFNIALATAYDAATIAPISATATTTGQSLTIGAAMASFSPLSAIGGTTPYSFSITSGTLPQGVSLNASTGVVSGTPTATYTTADVIFSVEDANNVVASTTSTVSFTVGVGTGTWTTTGNMIARWNNTATLLPNGKVLITGGSFIGGLTSAELYDPATGLFTATGSMGTARANHTATLLPNGKVLVTGGTNGDNIASAELYDPTTELFTATGDMGTARLLHTATLLNSGKVLISGGGSSANAELYDPATGLFTATGSMGTARVYHTATLLPNGKVLVTGGIGTTGGVTSAELYDPTTELFTFTGSMATPRYLSTATLLNNGTVLVTGGAGGGSTSAERYDPVTGLFTVTDNMATARNSHTATLLPDGKVLVAGGTQGGGASLSSAELYDPSLGLFTVTGNMVTAKFNHTATVLLSGKVLVTWKASTEVYQ